MAEGTHADSEVSEEWLERIALDGHYDLRESQVPDYAQPLADLGYEKAVFSTLERPPYNNDSRWVGFAIKETRMAGFVLRTEIDFYHEGEAGDPRNVILYVRDASEEEDDMNLFERTGDVDAISPAEWHALATFIKGHQDMRTRHAVQRGEIEPS